MSIKRREGGAWQKIGTLKRFTGSEWQNVSVSKYYDGTQWVPLWRESGTFSKIYTPVEYASYNITSGERLTGIAETNGMPRMIQGSANGRPDSIISTMIFFPLDEIVNDLHDAEITRISIDLKKTGGTPANAQTFVLIHYGGGYTSCPESWNGSDRGDADNWTPYLADGQSATFSLNNMVGEALRDRKATFISLNAYGLSDPIYHTEYDASYVRLRINYSV